MLVFVDESEWPRPKDPSGFTVWAAIAIHPKVSKDFFREIFQLEQKFWKVEEPYEFEIKGKLLLNKTAVTSPKKREFCEEIVSLCKLNGVKAFAAGLKNADALTQDGRADPIIYRAYSRILERVNAMMAERESDDMAIIALDSQDEKTDTRRARAFGNFLYGNAIGRSLNHIVETPFFVSSKATVGIQIADLLAYALSQQNLGRTDIRAIGDRFRELEWRSKWDDASPRRGFRFEDLNINPNYNE